MKDFDGLVAAREYAETRIVVPRKPKDTDVNNYEWRDRSSYSQGDRGNVPPTAWSMGLDGQMDVVVHRWIYDPGKWFVSCTALNVDKHPLKAQDAVNAQYEALEILEKRATQLRAALVAAILKTS